MDRVVDPCLLEAIKREGIPDHMSKYDVLERVKEAKPSVVNGIVNATRRLTEDTDSWSERKRVYRVALKVCKAKLGL